MQSSRGGDVLVIGAGVSGLTTAVCLAEAGFTVRVDTEQPPEATTSACAGATWDPYLVEQGPRAWGWATDTLSELSALAADGDRTGVRLLEGTHQSRTPCEPPSWAGLLSARNCDDTELRAGYAVGWRYRAPVIDMPAYLGYLTRRLSRAGGRLRLRSHASLADAADSAASVVNCSGADARNLVPDGEVTPCRGDLVVVENPGIRDFFCDDTPGADELVYFFPQGRTVALGGTAQPDVADRRPDAAAADRIVARCAEVEPALAGARVVEHRVGVRPLRPRVRLACLPLGDGLLVHNYGHGGAGVTLSWGCAREVVRMVAGRGVTS